MNPERRFTVTPRLVLGLAAIVAGLLFTLDNFGVLNGWEIVHRWWPVIFVAVGLVKLSRPDQRAAGAIFLVIGAWLLTDRLEIFPHGFWRQLWPIVLIVVGILTVRRAFAGPGGEPAAPATGEARIAALALMGGFERKITSQEFRGGEATAIMGGCNIDLRRARLAGGRAVIQVFAMWGGVELIVPENWTVVGEVWPIMGAYEDKRRGAAAGAPAATAAGATTDPAAGPPQTLFVKGMVIMGGVEVKN